MTNVNDNIQIKDITFTKNYVEQLIESIYKTTMSELFNAAHSKIQTHQFILKIYKIVFNFKIVRKSVRNVVVLRLTTVFDLKSIFQDFSNLVHQICFEILIYYDLTNKTISISIELAYFLFLFVLRAHVFQMLLIASFSHSFSLLLTIIFIDVTIFFIFTSVIRL